MRVLTITCNAAIDTTYLVERLRCGEINRVERVLPVPGGKGNNVARVLAALGQRPIATGFAGGPSGQAIVERLAAAGVEPAFVAVEPPSRTCLTIVERASGRTTEIREPGEPLADADGARLLDRLRELAPQVGLACISGSLPPGLDASFARSMIEVLKDAGVVVALDASGATLRAGLAARPDLITPNVEEFAELSGLDPEELLAGFDERQPVDRGLGTIVPETTASLLSMGGAGAALFAREERWIAAAPPVDVVNTVGAGDALLAGWLDARSRGESSDQALRQAVAVGTASTLQAAVGTIAIEDVARLRSLVRVSAYRTPAAGGASLAHDAIGQGRGRRR